MTLCTVDHEYERPMGFSFLLALVLLVNLPLNMAVVYASTFNFQFLYKYNGFLETLIYWLPYAMSSLWGLVNAYILSTPSWTAGKGRRMLIFCLYFLIFGVKLIAMFYPSIPFTYLFIAAAISWIVAYIMTADEKYWFADLKPYRLRKTSSEDDYYLESCPNISVVPTMPDSKCALPPPCPAYSYNLPIIN